LSGGPRQKAAREYRGQIPSPGRPTIAWREDRVRFWAAIARGVKTEDGAVEAGVSGPVAFRPPRTIPAEGVGARNPHWIRETVLGSRVDVPT